MSAKSATIVPVRDGLGDVDAGQVLEFLEGQVVVDMHGEAPGVGPKSHILTGR